jgi:hypothetical protein
VVGELVAEEFGGLVVGEKLVPAAGPEIVVAGVEGMEGGRDRWVVPEQICGEWFIGDLPDFAAELGQDGDAEKSVFKQHKV